LHDICVILAWKQREGRGFVGRNREIRGDWPWIRGWSSDDAV